MTDGIDFSQYDPFGDAAPVAPRQRVGETTLDQLPGESKKDAAARQTHERFLVRQAEKAKKEAEAALKAQQRKDAAERRRRELQQLADEGAIIPAPSDPMAVCRELVADHINHVDGVPTWTWWRGEFYAHSKTRWETLANSIIEMWAYQHTETAKYESFDRFGEPTIEDWAPNSTKVHHLVHALSRGVLQRDPRSDSDDSPNMIACGNGVLDVSTYELLRHTPTRFNLFALPFEYDPAAECPVWERFLRVIFEHDPDLIRLLQQWFGYVISGRTDLQKILSIIGPRRCGKGTIDRTLKALLGDGAWCSPKINQLGTQFGRACMIGKRLATFSDVRWNTRNAAEAVEVLLGVSGEDADTIPRKNCDDWIGKLPTRLMLISNDEPRFTDPSGAMAGRLLNMPLKKSFFGKENTSLGWEIMAELPGILCWSLDGLRDLNREGEFITPRSSQKVSVDLARSTQPELAFVEDHCEIVSGSTVKLDDLYELYKHWCESEGRDHLATKDRFSRSLRAALIDSVPDFDVKRTRDPISGVKVRVVVGLRIVINRYGKVIVDDYVPSADDDDEPDAGHAEPVDAARDESQQSEEDRFDPELWGGFEQITPYDE
jgi:putative DNA primase/helicase